MLSSSGWSQRWREWLLVTAPRYRSTGARQAPTPPPSRSGRTQARQQPSVPRARTLVVVHRKPRKEVHRHAFTLTPTPQRARGDASGTPVNAAMAFAGLGRTRSAGSDTFARAIDGHLGPGDNYYSCRAGPVLQLSRRTGPLSACVLSPPSGSLKDWRRVQTVDFRRTGGSTVPLPDHFRSAGSRPRPGRVEPASGPDSGLRKRSR
jgi:hypothetical protein